MKDGNPRHFYWIDWIRFLAALMVVIGHTRFQHFPYYDELLIPGKGKWSEFLFLIPRFANEAVTVFFVLSGFLVGGRCLERILTDRFDLGQYFVDRFTRILLPLVPVVLLTWMVTWIRGEPISVVEGLGNIASVQGVFVKPMTNNTSLWSLSYEVWFYVAAGAVALVVTGSSLRGKVWGLILAFTSMAIFTRLEASYFFIWMLGALAYFIGRDPADCYAVVRRDVGSPRGGFCGTRHRGQFARHRVDIWPYSTEIAVAHAAWFWSFSGLAAPRRIRPGGQNRKDGRVLRFHVSSLVLFSLSNTSAGPEALGTHGR